MADPLDQLEFNLTELLRDYKDTKEVLRALQASVDVFFLFTMSIIIFFMQAGFALLECGAVRSKNTTNILIKNMLDAYISGIAYWGFGYALAFGEPDNAFLGWRYWFSEGIPDEKLSHWFFHFVFAATAATIVSGAMAERCEFIAYFFYSSMITGFVYPIVTHWAWSEKGWLAVGFGGVGYQDFAGSGVVHLLGGTAALVGAAFLGARIGRFDDDGTPKPISGHNVPLAALGGFILMFGFFAFNGGSQASVSKSGDGLAISHAMMNTIISASFAAFTALLAKKFGPAVYYCDRHSTDDWKLLSTINGALTGMVAVCAGCNVMEPWAACVLGLISGITYLLWSWGVEKMKIDDPLDAVAVHGGGGLCGLLLAPILKIDGIIYNPSNTDAWLGFGVNMLGAVAIIFWTAAISAIIFGSLKAFKLLRVEQELEIRGLDVPKHGEPAYPSEAWGDGWSAGHINAKGKNRMNSSGGLETFVLPVVLPGQEGDDKSGTRKDSQVNFNLENSDADGYSNEAFSEKGESTKF
ncbi:putative ammonium transporter 1 [Lingula anatina]|uniref:Ammonium transporter n=1 Tax=Lingula anatina TaxID=7574 RepID=A0A1S3JYA9_LINAN|nr:putative ammonium transporter 1 [Lingula anatina]|eukprot:XP_013415373.1 putative ammonium transporter 1 [Lingula anatina]